MKINNYSIIASGMTAITLTSGIILSSITVSASSVVDTVKIKIPISCTMSSSISSGNEHNASVQNGTYREDIGATEVKAFCNYKNGFSIYAVGFTDDTYGNTVLSNSTLGESFDIYTNAEHGSSTSSWAMKIIADSSSAYVATVENGFNNYSAVPNQYTKIASSNTSTDVGAGAQGATITTTYAAYISQSQPAGTYVGKVKYTLVYPSSAEPPQSIDTAPGYIGYYPNAIGYSGSMALQAIGDSDTSATLVASNYVLEGYGFAGWNDKFDYSGNYYGPNEDISFVAGQYTGTNKGLSLYAVWVKSTGTLQDWQGCSSLSLNNVTALTDSRDGNTYAVAKLADNKCWMTENLRLDNSASASSMSSGSQGIGSGFTALPESSNSWNETSTTMLQINTSNNANGKYSYGTYYSWAAAIASTENHSSYNSSVNTSICPTGWRLPTGGQTTIIINADYYILTKSVTSEEPNQNPSGGYGYYSGENYSNQMRKYPINLVYSGKWSGNEETQNSGYYWTATTNSSDSAYQYTLSNNTIRPGNSYDSKTNGLAVRCVTGN